jgi:hypothetical protein
MFSKQVDMRSRTAMIAFLTEHFRYDTMSSWNNLTSYANKVKLWDLGLTQSQMDKAFEVLQTEYWDEISAPIEEFRFSQNNCYTIRSNGRSGGYLVLYRCHMETLSYKSFCRACGQQNYALVQTEAPEGISPAMWDVLKGIKPSWDFDTYQNNPAFQELEISGPEKMKMLRTFIEGRKNFTLDNRCGRCGSHSRVNYQKPPQTLRIETGGIDQEKDFEEWTMDELRERVRLVQAFDQACDEVRENFIELLEDSEVIEETIMVPKVRKILRSANL